MCLLFSLLLLTRDPAEISRGFSWRRREPPFLVAAANLPSLPPFTFLPPPPSHYLLLPPF